jgi:sensor histidine kinase YesM
MDEEKTEQEVRHAIKSKWTFLKIFFSSLRDITDLEERSQYVDKYLEKCLNAVEELSADCEKAGHD